MTPQQTIALAHPCLRPEERADTRFRVDLAGTPLVVSVDADGDTLEWFGGPVWHASVPSEVGESAAWVLADRALEGIGDSSLGEWVEEGADGAVHVRRRLSEEEARRVPASPGAG
jgi:hypothetical protein